MTLLVAPDALTRHPEDSTEDVGSLPLDAFLIAMGRHAEQALEQRFGSTAR
jgi:hypothetical protein